MCAVYPSIIRGHKLDYSTIVLDPRYDNLPGVEYYRVKTDQGDWAYAQTQDAVLPSMLEDLAKFRKQAKKDMAAAKARGDTFAEAMYNSKQLAYKIVMNSTYGFTGASDGMLSCVPIAASVTATGRQMIKRTKELAELMVPGSRVVYGDSVAAYTPVWVRGPDGGPRLTTIECVTDGCPGKWVRLAGGKEAFELAGVQTWSDGGWTDVERVIRHRAGKPMVRVVTASGYVDVTIDHSLVRADGSSVSPRDVRIGDALLHTPIPPHECLLSQKPVKEAPDPKSQLRAAQCFALCDSFVAYKASIDVDTLEVVNGVSTNCEDPRIKRLDDIDYAPGAFVYDLTTANNHFAAGVGRLVVHNTDSVMVLLDLGEHTQDMQHVFQKAEWLAGEISKDFPHPVMLEFEKGESVRWVCVALVPFVDNA